MLNTITKVIAALLLLTAPAYGAQQGITNAQIKTGANIAHSKMAPLSASKMAETSAGGVVTTSSFGPATSANTASTGVARDGSGNFSAGTISANLSGNASTATALAADPSACGAGLFVNDIAANGTLTCGAVTGSPAPATSTKTTSYTLTAADDEIIMACTSACTLTAPNCSTLGANKTWHIQKVTRPLLSGASTGGNLYQLGTRTSTSYTMYPLKAFDIHCNQGSTLYVR